MSRKSRPPVQAGRFYPADPSSCEKELGRMLKYAEGIQGPQDPVVGVAPHAGWVFSGKLAAAALSALARAEPETVVITAAHTSEAGRVEVSSYEQWDTPIGPVQVDVELAASLQDLGLDKGDVHHDMDHSVEVQLPIMKKVMPGARLVAVAVPSRQDAVDVGRRIKEAAERLGRRIVMLASTDLTHYGLTYGWAPKGRGNSALKWVKDENDARIVEIIKNMDADSVVTEALKSKNACGAGGLAASLAFGRVMGRTKAEVLGYTTSYDVYPEGEPEMFVGYVAAVG